jgi:hypothetical protein
MEAALSTYLGAGAGPKVVVGWIDPPRKRRRVDRRFFGRRTFATSMNAPIGPGNRMIKIVNLLFDLLSLKYNQPVESPFMGGFETICF